MRERRKLNRVDVANRTYRPSRSRPRGRPVAFSAAVAGTAESARFHLWCVGSRFRPRWSSPGWSGAGVGSVRRVLHDRAATEPGPTRFCVRGIRRGFRGGVSPPPEPSHRWAAVEQSGRPGSRACSVEHAVSPGLRCRNLSSGAAPPVAEWCVYRGPPVLDVRYGEGQPRSRDSTAPGLSGIVPPAGFEPATSRIEAGCSDPLSYGGGEPAERETVRGLPLRDFTPPEGH